MLANQGKSEGRVIELVLGKPIHAVVAGHTVVAKMGDVSGDEISLVIAVARLAQRPVKMCQVLHVAISAGKRLAGGHGPVGRQRKAQHIVRKILEIHARERSLRAFMLGVATAAQQTFWQCAMQSIRVSSLSLDVGVAGQTAPFHLFAAPGWSMAGCASAADFGVRCYAAQPQTVPSHCVERPRIEHHSAGSQRGPRKGEHRHQSSYQAQWGKTANPSHKPSLETCLT